LKKAQDKIRSAREAALQALVRFEQDHSYLKLTLPLLVNSLAEQEKALAFKLAAGTVQHLNTLDWVLQLFSHRSLDDYTPWIRNLLRMSAFQLLYLERIPDYAIVNEAVSLSGRYGHRGVAGLVNALLRRLAVESEKLPWPDPGTKPEDYLSLYYSYPRWLVARKLKLYGFIEAEKWCLANQDKPLLTLRPNRMRTGTGELIARLAAAGIKAVESDLVPKMLQVESGNSLVSKSSEFNEGLMTIQGESSALVAPLLQPRTGDTIIDLCSAPGGKTTHLAELQNDTGRIYAVELHQSRVSLIERAAVRLGLNGIKTITADSREIELQNLPVPDTVLVDAPCSGLGVIRRLPEIKWRRREEDLKRFKDLQLELLDSGAKLLRPGGKLLYSVCSTEPEEAEEVAAAFTETHPGFLLQPLFSLLPPDLQPVFKGSVTLTFLPHRHKLDGFFIAIWIKKRLH
jgi:16S rRNA (cytosine967-C5)-methyltransferase